MDELDVEVNSGDVPDAQPRSPRKSLLPPPPAWQEVFTVEEAAAFARVTPGKIDQWTETGLKHWRTGSPAGASGPAHVIILRKHLLEWIESHARAASTGIMPEKPKRGRPRTIKGAACPDGGEWLTYPSRGVGRDPAVEK
jgi:hypothetical protein